MKKLLALTLAAFAGSFLALALLGLPIVVRAGGNPVRETRVPGDTNCDDRLDLSDAVYILNFLFLSTAGPPCPIADPPELVAQIAQLESELEVKSTALESCLAQLSTQLPASGQATCYGIVDEQGGWGPVPCENATCPGQDGFYRTGCQPGGRLVDNGNGTVTDNCTGLMWQKDTADADGDGQSTLEDLLPWCEALAYCENLSFAGHDDWRLPNVRELQSIVDYGRFEPAIDPVFGAFSFSATTYWSSTPSAVVLDDAWLVYLYHGAANIERKGSYWYVRAVRTSP